MSALSLNSISNYYVRTTVAQQQVAIDRANVLRSESQLNQDQAQLDKDLTYLATISRKTQSVQRTEGTQAQATALSRFTQNAQVAQQAAQKAQAALSSATTSNQAIGTKVNVVA